MLELLDDDLRGGAPRPRRRARAARARARPVAPPRPARGDLLDLSRLDAEVELRSRARRARRAEPRGPRRVRARHRRARDQYAARRRRRPRAGRSATRAASRRSCASCSTTRSVHRARIGDPRHAATAARGRWRSASATHGPGVPAAERELIFERFQRGRETGGRGRVRPRPGDRPGARRADGRRARARGRPTAPGATLHAARLPASGARYGSRVTPDWRLDVNRYLAASRHGRAGA